MFAVLPSISRDRVPGSSPTIATGIFSPRSLLSSAQEVSRCSLKVFPPDVYRILRRDVKPSVLIMSFSGTWCLDSVLAHGLQGLQLRTALLDTADMHGDRL